MLADLFCLLLDIGSYRLSTLLFDLLLHTDRGLLGLLNELLTFFALQLHQVSHLLARVHHLVGHIFELIRVDSPDIERTILFCLRLRLDWLFSDVIVHGVCGLHLKLGLARWHLKGPLILGLDALKLKCSLISYVFSFFLD